MSLSLLHLCPQEVPFRAAAALLLLGLLAGPAYGQNTFTVNTTGDAADANAGSGGDGICATFDGDCTLRAAIQEANATSNAASGPDRIEFEIPGSASPTNPHVIQPGNELPNLTDPVIIDGTTESDYGSGADPKPVIEIDGSNAGRSTNGIVFQSSGNTVRGLAIVNFSRNGFDTLSRRGQTIVGCHIGVRADGTTPAGNNFGIISEGGDQIGGPGSDAGNIIASNSASELRLNESNTTVQGNFIGTNPRGDDLGDGSVGIDINGSEHVIGGIGSGEGNVVAFNGGGVFVVNGTGVTIRGNEIFANSSQGIGLGTDGRTPNDDSPAGSEDDDDGDNRLQNFPVLTSTSYDSGADEVTVTYEVPSQPGLSTSGASTYPLEVDFYRAETSTQDAEGEAYLGTDTYTASAFNDGPTRTVTFTPDASVTTRDKIVATATDANGNTSEFSGLSSPLPVELASFEGTQTDDATVELRWTTASETSNAGFRVQHRRGNGGTPNGKGPWKSVGFVESNASGGTTTEATPYRFTAEDLGVGTHQFRLKQMDLNGSAHLHEAVTVTVRMEQAARLRAPAPNPVRNQATLSFAVKEAKKATLTLYNALGQEVRTVYAGRPAAGETQKARLDASTLASGVYVLRLRVAGAVKTRKLTVLK